MFRKRDSRSLLFLFIVILMAIITLSQILIVLNHRTKAFRSRRRSGKMMGRHERSHREILNSKKFIHYKILAKQEMAKRYIRNILQEAGHNSNLDKTSNENLSLRHVKYSSNRNLTKCSDMRTEQGKFLFCVSVFKRS